MGKRRYRYVLGERRKFVYHDPYHNPSRCKIVYYQGQRIWRDRDEDDKRIEILEDVSFVCFHDRGSAKQVVKCYQCRRIQRCVLLEAKFYTYDSKIKKHLVCFERFDGFVPQPHPKYLTCLKAPNCLPKVPGNANHAVQDLIKWKISALIHMHSVVREPWLPVEVGVSSSLLHLPIAYVWSRAGRKFFMVDSCKEDHTDAEWKKIVARDVERFGIGLNEYFLKTTMSWPEKDSFMRCFSIRIPDENDRLPMILDHPFMQDCVSKILRIPASLHHSLRYADHDRDLTKLMAALHNSKQLKSEFMPDGVWTRPKMSTRFRRFLRGKPKGKSIKYNTKDMGDLLRFLNNLYYNGHKKGMTLIYIYKKIRKYWPHLMDRFHEKIAGYF